ncbi:YbfB/YjiJ family MFS transporter [Alcaligenaceae bacterium]|nr:YbfB/YjiJ family MFS transporter [Alcaligenaceae bacterium]
MSNNPPVRTLAWAGLVALAVAMGIGRFAFTPLLPMMQEDMGLGLAQGGWLASANYLGYFAGALTAAYLPWSASTLLRAGLLLVAATTALMGWTQVWSAWVAWRSIAGIASAWVLVATASLCLTRLAAAGASRNAGLVFAGVGGGIALAGLLCMAADLMGLSSARTWLMLGALAAAGLLATYPLWKAPAGTPSPEQAPCREGNGGGHPRLLLCYGLFGFGYILPATFLPAQARALLDDQTLFNLAWPLFGLAAAVSTLICSSLLQRFSRRQLWLAAQLLMAAGVALPALAPGLASIVAAAVCVGGTFMMVTMLGMQQAQASGGPRGQALMASLTAAFAGGQLAGPVFFSLLNEHLGATLESSLYMACAALLAGCLLLLKPFQEHAAGPEAGGLPDQSAR